MPSSPEGFESANFGIGAEHAVAEPRRQLPRIRACPTVRDTQSNPCAQLLTKTSGYRLVESMDSISEIMRTLRGGRALLGLSQEELAELAGVSRQIVVRIEKGESNVLVEAVEKVRTALEASGVAFIDATREHGPGVAMTRRPSAMDTDAQGFGDG